MKNNSKSKPQVLKGNRRKNYSMKSQTYNVDIALEFNEIKTSIANLADKINLQTTEFERQLSKLNTNMETVLNLIANHEVRLLALELKQIRDDEHHETLNKFKSVGLKIIYGVFWTIVVIGAANGIKPLVKIFNLFAN